MPPRAKRKLTPPVPYPAHNPADEEVFSIHTLSDDSASPAPPQKKKGNRRESTRALVAGQGAGSSRRQTRGASRGENRAAAGDGVITISDGDEETHQAAPETDDEDVMLEEVDVAPRHWPSGGDEELEMQLEEVNVDGYVGEDHSHASAYAAAYEAAAAQQDADEDGGPVSQPVFKDGKGQPGGITISLSAPARKAALAAKRSGITTKDRQTRMATHKWMVLSMIAHSKRRNALLNDEDLRDRLYALVPNNYLEKLRAIHPKKVPIQNERVRQFEAVLRDLTRWWSFKFRLDPNQTTGAALRQPDPGFVNGSFPRPGRRVDGWVVESAKEREDRHRQERRKEKEATGGGGIGEGSASEAGGTENRSTSAVVAGKTRPFLSEITLFGVGGSTTPVFLRLATATERIEQASDLEEQIEGMSGSRETKAQLFTALCRALGIPCRLVISIQAPSWSVTASKVASTAGAASHDGSSKESSLIKKKRAMGARNEEQKRKRRAAAQRPDEDMTSDDDGFVNTMSGPGSGAEGSVKRRRNGTASRPLSVTSTGTGPSAATSATGTDTPPITRRSVRGTVTTPKGKDKAEEGETGVVDNDYRDDKWKNLEAPLDVKYEPKLRIQKPKQLKPGEIGADSLSDVEPVNASAPPTVWVEVFSKPWQRWITVDPVRGLVEPTGNRQMEPSPSDKSNRLVYVVAFEEDGYARDVTARYTKTLHSRVSRMRPPPTKVAGEQIDWWAKVASVIHRPQRLERDAMEDVELEGSAAREPMPSSVAAFKEHPVYTLEKHLKRDEVIFPAKQAGSFQGMPVFLRANVVACRSARQWYNQGRVIKAGEEALKWVRSRGYTIANKRAEEEARMQGQEALQEGLYALFQTQLYQAPPVVEGRVPTNSFGNIDLFVETMMPKGASHVPYSGAVRVAKKLGIHYAEAIVSRGVRFEVGPAC